MTRFSPEKQTKNNYKKENLFIVLDSVSLWKTGITVIH